MVHAQVPIHTIQYITRQDVIERFTNEEVYRELYEVDRKNAHQIVLKYSSGNPILVPSSLRQTTTHFGDKPASNSTACV